MATPTVMADGTALLAALEGCAIWLDEMELAEPTIGPDSTPLHSDLIPSHANKAVFRAFATDGVVDVTSLLLHFTTTDPWMDGVDKAFALLAHDSRIGFAKFVKLVHMGGPSVDEEGHITSPELLATAFEEAVNLQRPPTTEEQGEDQAALAETVTLQTLRDCPATARVLAACSPHYEHTLVYDLTFPPPPEEPQQEGEEGAEGGGEGDEPKPAEEGTTEA